MLKTNSAIRKKRTYSTFTKFCYQKGTLPKDILKNIPRSTKFNWQKNICLNFEDDIINAFEKNALDYAEVFAEKEKAIGLSNALVEIINTFQKIINEHTLKKKILFANKNIVLATIEKLKDSIGFQKSCDYFSITTQQYFAWKNNIDCTASLLKLCRKRFSSQLMDKDVVLIKEYLDNKEFENLSRATVYWKIIRDGGAAFSISCFYKYCKLLGFGRRTINDKCKKNKEGIKATKVAEILHTDITYVKTKDGKTSYLSFVEDNFSKRILLGEATEKPDSLFLKNNIETVLNKHNLIQIPLKLIVDDGSENKGFLDAFLKTDALLVTKIIARVDIPLANNVVEALHKKFKNEFLRDYTFENHTELVAALPVLIEKYNNQYHAGLFGYSPQEVWDGAMPDKNSFTTNFAIACQKRKEANSAFNCCKS
jgi:putative transposase